VTPGLTALVTFLVVIALVVAPYYFFVLREEAADQEMIRHRIKTGRAVVRTDTRGALFKDVERLSVIGPLDRALAGNSRAAVRLRDVIQLSGVKVTPGQLVFGSLSLALVAYLVVFLRTQSALLGAIAGALVVFLPYGVLVLLRSRRLNKFEEQFPEAVDLIARALRAGHAFTTGLGMAAEELAEPAATEFKLLFDQQNYGLPLNDALRDLARRIPLIDARFFVTAVLTQREAGGNLAEVLDNLSRVMRERFKIRRQLRVLTAHGRLTGWILAGLPPAMAFYMFLMRPSHFRLLIDDPLGVKMIITAVVLQIFGAFLIYKISDVEY
jgi:tight adherence protein B